MGVAECLDRTQHHLAVNQIITDAGRKVLEEAVSHLQAALDTPGWQEWMDNGVYIPFEADADTFPPVVRNAWSDSMDTNPDVIDARGMRLLRELNKPGKDLHEIHIDGWTTRADKCPDFFEEMEREEKRAMREEQVQNAYLRGLQEEQSLEKVRVNKEHATKTSAAKKPVAMIKSKPSAKRKSPSKKDALQQRLDEAASNSEKMSLPAPGSGSLPRPLPETVHTKSRSAKVNHVVDTILTSAQDDKYVIFGDIYELEHLTEALDLFDIKSYDASYL